MAKRKEQSSAVTNTAILMMDESALSLYWSHVCKTDSCWLWTGRTDNKGYGTFAIPRKVSARAHRISLFLAKGPPLFQKAQACHTTPVCKYKNCVNPDHLYWGTAADNVRDSLLDLALRSDETIASLAYARTIPTAMIKDIWRDYYSCTDTAKVVGSRYGVTGEYVHMIVKRLVRKADTKHLPAKIRGKRPPPDGVCRQNQWKAKLRDKDVQAIRRSLAAGRRQDHLAKAYGVSKSTICFIGTGRTWKTLPWPKGLGPVGYTQKGLRKN